MIKTIDLSKFKSLEDIENILKLVQKGDDQFLIKYNGKPLAAIISSDDLDFLVEKQVDEIVHEVKRQTLARERLFRIMDEVQKQNEGFSIEEVEHDIEAAKVAIRKAYAKNCS